MMVAYCLMAISYACSLLNTQTLVDAADIMSLSGPGLGQLVIHDYYPLCALNWRISYRKIPSSDE